ncbi:MAG: protein kinase domain-containing protein [Myxococcota bacterium]
MSERYRLTRQVASGGMAEVYLGVATGEEGFEKPVAIKRILPQLAKDSAVARMFLGEVRAATHLHHQNIVQVLDVGKSPDGLYIVMELVDGWDLADVLDALTNQGRRFPPQLAAFVVLQAVTGLAHAYKKTLDGKPLIVAHRDISPSNLLLSVEGEVKVADFGIAKLEALSTGTEPGTFKGKVAYAAPEALCGETVTAASDQFSLGLVLYEMLAGGHPFGKHENMLAYVGAIQHQEPPPLTGLPTPLVHVVERLLKKKPAERFPSADALSRALAEYLARAGEPATNAELAQLLGTLSLPPRISQRSGAEASAQGSFSLHGTSAPGLMTGTEFELFDWQPTGPVLDPSGKIDHSPPSPQVALGDEDPFGKTSISGSFPKIDPSQLPPPPPPPAPAKPPPTLKPAGFEPPPEEPLELARDIRREAQEEDFIPPVETPRSGARWLGRGVMLLVTFLAAGAFLGLYLWPKRHALSKPFADKRVLYIDSEPPGAKVRINGKDIGTTPWIEENLYGPTDVSFQLIKEGYRPYAGTFRGGEMQRVEVKLKRK